jgi:hypothetical protein
MDLDESERPLPEDLWSASAAECVSAAQSVSVTNVNAAEKRRRQAVKPKIYAQIESTLTPFNSQSPPLQYNTPA